MLHAEAPRLRHVSPAIRNPRPLELFHNTRIIPSSNLPCRLKASQSALCFSGPHLHRNLCNMPICVNSTECEYTGTLDLPYLKKWKPLAMCTHWSLEMWLVEPEICYNIKYTLDFADPVTKKKVNYLINIKMILFWIYWVK